MKQLDPGHYQVILTQTSFDPSPGFVSYVHNFLHRRNSLTAEGDKC